MLAWEVASARNRGRPAAVIFPPFSAWFPSLRYASCAASPGIPPHRRSGAQLCGDPAGPRPAIRPAAADGPATGFAASIGHVGRRSVPRQRGPVPASGARGHPGYAVGARRRGAAARGPAAPRPGGLPGLCRADARRDSPGGGQLPPPRLGRGAGRIVQERDRRHPRQDRRGRRGGRQRERGASLDPRSPPEAAGPPPEHVGVVPAGPRNGEVPPGPDRHGPQRPLRARRPRRAPVLDSRHHSRRLLERCEPLPRAARAPWR